MATEATTNGVYDSQYNQPAELAASTPSHAASSATSQAGSSTQKADPQEIGWYFVEQYYTTLSKTPERIHLFYSKKSQLVTGVEADKVVPCVGTKAISEKIKALDIQDCKVRVLNVDAQSSFDNIVVQVIGEMSNKSQPHHKFVQTFVLATQPNGYFVLNDIFRYLNDEEVEIVEDQPVDEPVQVAEPVAEAEEPVTESVIEKDVNTDEAVAEVDAKLEDAEEPTAVEEEEKINGTAEEPVAAQADPEESAAPDAQESITATDAEQLHEPEPSPTAEEPPKSNQEQSSAAPAKKTWASLVGNKAPAIPALPAVTPAPGQSKPQRSPQPTSTAKSNTDAAPVPAVPTTVAGEWQTADHGKKAKSSQSKPATEGVVHAYIKNVTDKVDARELRRVLEVFGELKYFDVSRPRNCAFVEFVDPASYAAAVAANPHDVNSESISVEERRPRQGAYGSSNTNFARGGSNNATRGGRGGFQKEGSRGGFQQRGAKSGNVTPKGRGQTQAA